MKCIVFLFLFLPSSVYAQEHSGNFPDEKRNQLNSSVVRLFRRESHTRSSFAGTAFCCGRGFEHKLLFITAQHCIDEDRDFLIRTADDDVLPVVTVAQHSEWDVALLSSDLTDLPKLKLAASQRINQPVLVIGYPNGKHCFKETEIVGFQAFTNEPTRISLPKCSEPGSSGGPVFDVHGEVLGIVISHHKTNTYCVQLNQIRDFLILVARN